MLRAGRVCCRGFASQQLKVAHLRGIKPEGVSPRFYKDVSIAPLEGFSVGADVIVPGNFPAGSGSPWVVLLDGRGMVTPFGNLFCVPNEALACAVAGEWASQEDRIKPVLMPLMTLATTAIDIVPRTREKTVNDCVKFLSTDTVCFFADPATEPGLREMQEDAFLPVIEWFERRFSVKLSTNRADTDSFNVVFVQPEHTRAAVKEQLLLLNDWELSALDKASGEAKSTAVAAMLCAGELTPSEALDAAKTEERFQISRWGDIPMWHGIDYGLTRLNMSSVHFFCTTLRETLVAPKQ